MLAEWGDIDWNRAGFDLTYGWDSYKRLKAVWKGAPASSFVRGELPDMAAMPRGAGRMRFTTNHDETAWDNPPVAIFGPGAPARAAYVALTLLPGRPLLYNGQEVESPQKLPLFERELVNWDQPHADEARRFYARVLELARTQPALIRGDFVEIATTAPKDVIAYRRGGTVVLVNPRGRVVRVKVTGIEVKGRKDLLSGRSMGGNRLVLKPYEALVLQ
jgi:glycosidase